MSILTTTQRLHRCNRTNFHASTCIEGRAAFCDRRGLGKILRFDDREAADDLLTIGDRSIGNDPACSDSYALTLKWCTPVLESALFAELSKPVLPSFHNRFH